jgi:NAD+ synthase (glutamine-hydrolysing)
MLGFEPNLEEDPMLVGLRDFVWAPQTFESNSMQIENWERSPHLQYEEFVRIAGLGLFNYLQKSGLQGFTVCLSGGADSSMVVTLIYYMVERAVRELGIEGFKKALPRLTWLADKQDVRSIMSRMLHCVYLRAAGSSQDSEDSARELSEAVGCRFRAIDIEADAQALRKETEDYIGRTLDWGDPSDDLTLQNIYARTRGIRGWALANASNHLLVPPSDLSEIIVGYFTQGGDDSGGGPNPLGVRKIFILECLKHLEHNGPEGLPALPALHRVNNLQPSPELRPKEKLHTAEGELGPYVLRDFMQDLFLQELLGPVEVFERAVERWKQYSPAELHRWTRSFFKQFAVNQWKRERLPVTLHLDDHNLDPKSWLRWPVLSGNFETELAELDSVARNKYGVGKAPGKESGKPGTAR